MKTKSRRSVKSLRYGGGADGPPHSFFKTMNKIKHEDLLLLGKNYASATFSSPDWPTTAVVVFRDISNDGRSILTLESINGPWGATPYEHELEGDYNRVCGEAIILMRALNDGEYEYGWAGRIWNHQ